MIEGKIMRMTPVKFLININTNKNILRISKDIDATYSYIYTLSRKIEGELITIKKEGRINKVELTEKGKEVKKELLCLLEALKNVRKEI